MNPQLILPNTIVLDCNPSCILLTVIEEYRTSKSVVCNALISLHEREVLLSDAVIEELEIEILSPKTGLWKFKGEDKVRRSK